MPNGGAQDFDLSSVRIRKDDVLYFIVDANGSNHSCDSTALNLKIALRTQK